MRFSEIFVETVAETQEIIKLSTDIVDFIYLHKDRMVPGTMFSLRDMGLTAKTPAVQTIVNATRIKIVDPKVFKTAGTAADAAPYYTDAKGNMGPRAYDDARTSRDFNQGKIKVPVGMTTQDFPEYKDLISSSAGNGNKLDIRINATILDFDKPRQLEQVTSTLSHEFTHHLDTVKGRNTVATYDASEKAKQAQQQLDAHNRAKEMLKNPRPGLEDVVPAGLLTPEKEKELIGIVKRVPKSVPLAGGELNRAYFAEVPEINARLTEAAGNLAEYIKGWKYYDNYTMKETIEHFMTNHAITNCFVPFKTEAEFMDSLNKTRLTPEQIKQAYANPEFQKLYARIFKFMQAELEPGGIIAQAQKDGFKNWNKSNQALGGQTPKATFIERFIQQIVKGVEAVKDVAKQVVRRYAQGTVALEKIIVKMIPEFMAKSGVKSIPLIGILFGVAFAIPRLFKGDAPGAGIEVASSVGSLFTVIPLVAYQIARDLYGEEYMYFDTGKPAVLEYDYANDPEGTKERIAELQDKIAKILKERLQQNAPNYPMAFSNTAGGAAVGNPKIAAQGERSRSNPTPAYESLDRIIELSAVKKPT